MSLKKIFKWVKRRLTERSTYVGLATVAAALGADKLGVQIGQVGEIVGVATGAMLMGVTTSKHPPVEELL